MSMQNSNRAIEQSSETGKAFDKSYEERRQNLERLEVIEQKIDEVLGSQQDDRVGLVAVPRTSISWPLLSAR